MADDLQLTCWMTPVAIPATETTTRGTGGDTLYLLPQDYSGKPVPQLAKVRLLKTGDNAIKCQYKPKVSVGHVWSPDPALPGSAAPFTATAAVVHIDLPATPFWSGADFTPQLTATPSSVGPTPPTAPVESDKSKALLIPKNGWELDVLPLPGEEMITTHRTYGHGDFAISAYHTTKALTGGWIRAKRPHPTVAEAYVYDVYVEGTLFTDVLPTDFEPRSVNDWCFLLRNIADSYDQTFAATTPASPVPGEVLRMAPLQILGKG